MAAEAEQAQQMEMINRLGPQAISQMGGMAKQGMANEAEQGMPPNG
jgi:hypothetical protein